MPVDSLAAGALVLSWGATYLLHSTLLLCGVWLFLQAKRALGHSFREALWKTALVGGVFTASFQILLPPGALFGKFTLAIDEFPLTNRTPNMAGLGRLDIGSGGLPSNVTLSDDDGRTIDFAEAERVGADGDLFAVTRGPAEKVALLNEPDTALPEGAQDATLPEAAGTTAFSVFEQVRRISAAVVCLFVVCVGLVAVMLGVTRCAWQTLSLRRKLGRSSPVSAGPARRLLDELLCHVPQTPLVLLFSDPADPEPAAFGIRQWTIVLPERAAQDLPEDELRALLAHELAHLVPAGARWLFVSRIICSCLAFQPLNHLARREWQRAAEFLCDEWAVSRTGARLALARCLAEVAGWRLSGQPSAALLAATGRKSSLADRIERLVASADVAETWNELRCRRWMLVTGAVGLALLAWCTPRVQLAVAAPTSTSTSDVDSYQLRAAGRDKEANDAETREVNLTDAAKPQADGESGLVPGDAPAIAPPSSSTGASSRRTESKADVATLLASLDRELSALEGELRDLEPMLRQGDASPVVQKLAERIHAEIVLLAKRRDALRTHWKKSVP